MPDALPAAGAKDLGSFDVIRRNQLQAGDHDDHDDRCGSPQLCDNDRHEQRSRVLKAQKRKWGLQQSQPLSFDWMTSPMTTASTNCSGTAITIMTRVLRSASRKLTSATIFCKYSK